MTNNKYRSAVILCGGKGTRLGSLSKKIPKSLAKIQNYPILWFIINILKKNKFNHFILPIGYKGDQIKKFIKKSFPFEKNIQIINTGISTSIAFRIHKIKKFVKSDNFLLLNGDAIFNFDLDRYSSSYSVNSSSRDFFLLGGTGLLLRVFGVSSVGSLDVPHEAQNFAFDLSLCPQLSQNAMFY